MRRVQPRKRKSTSSRQSRHYHLVDDDTHAFESGENPDWLVGAY